MKTAITLLLSISLLVPAQTLDPYHRVVIADSRIAEILGPMFGQGYNPWSWFDNRAQVHADFQASRISTDWNPSVWDTAAHSGATTVSVTNGSNVLTLSSATAKTDFCNGTTSPVSSTGMIAVWYNSSTYPGTTGRAFLPVTGCPSTTTVTISGNWRHEAGTQSGLSYSIIDMAVYNNWVYGPIPANYYDNVLAYYAQYYRTGNTSYRTSARNLAAAVWRGPIFDRGKNYDDNTFGGDFIYGGAFRFAGMSAAGLVLWSIDTGENIWPGMHFIWSQQKHIGWDFASSRSWNVQMGDIREIALYTRDLALCSMYDTDSTWRATCTSNLKDYINNIWSKQVTVSGHKTWQNTQAGNAFYASNAGGLSVHVVNGSKNITLNCTSPCSGVTWSASTFWNANHPGSPGTQLEAYLWFWSNPLNSELPGMVNADVGGDSVAYQVASVTDGTHAVLTQNYVDAACNSGCDKGMEVSAIVGFGTQPFMLGIAGGALVTYARDAMLATANTVEAAKCLQYAKDAVDWLDALGIDHNNFGTYGARGFINCEPTPNNDPSCGSGPTFNGESLQLLSNLYALAPTVAIKTLGDGMFNAVFCKPGGSWTCNGMQPQTYTISAVGNTYPANVTVTNMPYDIAGSRDILLLISGVLGTGCSGLNNWWTAEPVDATKMYVFFDPSTCTYTANSGKVQTFLYPLDDGQQDLAATAQSQKWWGYYWGMGSGSAWAAVTAVQTSYPFLRGGVGFRSSSAR